MQSKAEISVAGRLMITMFPSASMGATVFSASL